MVCLRCKLAVKDKLLNLGIAYDYVEMGEVLLPVAATSAQLAALQHALLLSGLSLFDDKKTKVVEKIKALVIAQVHDSQEPLMENFSQYLSKKCTSSIIIFRHFFQAPRV